jgi:hypothetical protein
MGRAIKSTEGYPLYVRFPPCHLYLPRCSRQHAARCGRGRVGGVWQSAEQSRRRSGIWLDAGRGDRRTLRTRESGGGLDGDSGRSGKFPDAGDTGDHGRPGWSDGSSRDAGAFSLEPDRRNAGAFDPRFRGERWIGRRPGNECQCGSRWHGYRHRGACNDGCERGNGPWRTRGCAGSGCSAVCGRSHARGADDLSSDERCRSQFDQPGIAGDASRDAVAAP